MNRHLIRSFAHPFAKIARITHIASTLILFTLVALTVALVLSGCGVVDAPNGSSNAANGSGGETTSGSGGNGSSGSGGAGGGKSDAQQAATAPLVKDADLVIPLSDVSATARFYPVEIDGTQLEVLAVKAPDGSIRTAFNTCQVCYDSGRGYYEQEGNVLVCQNCGNRFAMDQVEIQSGGCNPVPIFDEDKDVTSTQITISKAYLTQAKDIFANWKTQY